MWTSVFHAIGALASQDDEKRDFDLAAERIQTALLNVTVPLIERLDIGVRAEPARLVGGDYIDIFSPDGKRLLFGLGDASGKSLAAALNALMLRYLVRGLVQALGFNDLQTVLKHTNRVVSEDFRNTDHFITLILGTFDAGDGRFTIANAGHEPPLIMRAGAADVEIMETHDLVLGVNEESHYTEASTVLLPGDKAVIYTDGLTEATNTRGELFTIERLREDFLAHRETGAQALADSLFEAVKAYAGDHMRDDATILVLHRLP